MNHNDINRQCAEAMGWKDRTDEGMKFVLWEIGKYENDDPIYQVGTPKFTSDWTAMKLLMEYANDHDFALGLSEETKGACCAELISRKRNGGYFYDYADTFTEAAALAFLKCFGKEGE